MDVDKILPSSSTLGWHSLQVKGEVQTRKGLWWIPRHPETRKGVAERRSRWTTGEYSCTTPCWSRGTEEARLAERWLSVQGRKVPLLFQGKKG
ncbi:hypothetical protein Ahy_A08g038858 [Arachis hypogaea]|uniref:Uncharacterized protein n=3 Tax=Magnoliopsida TaxID=3398 RepID=A0A445BUX6_ARAHY|nr:hypothetical protein Ahy_A08g038858 [Arachis hypogaea]